MTASKKMLTETWLGWAGGRAGRIRGLDGGMSGQASGQLSGQEICFELLLARGYSVLRNSASGPETGLPGRFWAGLLPGKY